MADLEKYIDQGKIRYIGLSNETPWGIMSYLQISKNKNLPRMMAIQNPYNLLNRTYEIGVAEVSIIIDTSATPISYVLFNKL